MAIASPWVIEEQRGLRGYSVEWAEPGNLILARRNELLSAARTGPPFQPLGRLPVPAWKSLACRARYVQRACGLHSITC